MIHFVIGMAVGAVVMVVSAKAYAWVKAKVAPVEVKLAADVAKVESKV